MPTSRRGFLAASLAVMVAGALGLVSTMSAEAEQVPATAAPEATHTPPALLPWGDEPQPMRTGRAGSDSDALRASGVAAAPPAASTSLKAAAKPKNVPKGRIGKNGTPVPPPPTASPATSKTSFYYNVGAQVAATDGFYANVTIARPTLSTKDAHTLAELAVQSADSRQVVEIGWTVDRVLNGNDDPHLFVYHWVNGAETCYNACGFVQYSSTVKPGDTLAPGTASKFGIQYAGGAWWVTFGTEWIGYFPEKLWLDQGVPSFSRTGVVQIFGEVAGADQPCTQMGNGLAGTNSAAAALASVTFTNGPAVALDVRSTHNAYAVSVLSARSFQYGGGPGC